MSFSNLQDVQNRVIQIRNKIDLIIKLIQNNSNGINNNTIETEYSILKKEIFGYLQENDSSTKIEAMIVSEKHLVYDKFKEIREILRSPMKNPNFNQLIDELEKSLSIIK